MQTNALYYGDNLDILQRYVPDESVDLVYLDPPFNSNRDYNVIFKDESGRKSDAQLLAFEDTWHWGPSAETTYAYLTNTLRHQGRVPDKVSTIIAALRAGIGSNQMMAYLVEMTVRLVELHRVLKPTGSLYLHCDPTASHYLKLVLDSIFGPAYFRNELVWQRHNARSVVQRIWPRLHDVILWYVKTEQHPWRPTLVPSAKLNDPHDIVVMPDGLRYRTKDLTGQGVRTGETGKPWRGVDPTPKGRHWRVMHSTLDALDVEGRIHWQARGFPRERAREPYEATSRESVVGDVWADIDSINSGASERLGYPTQKPLALLERIISASSNPGDVVLDPFCGCGTALIAAEKLGRRWIGIDITYLSIAVMKARLKDSFGIETPVIGQPTEVEGARQLAQSPEGRYQFQWWALNLVDAKPIGSVEKKGADRGIDGRITFTTGPRGEIGQALVSVKSGHVTSGMVRDLKGTLEREKAEIGLFVTLEEPTKEMLLEATTAGSYTSPITGRDYPRIQLLSIRELLEDGRKAQLPVLVLPTYQVAERIPSKRAAEQEEMFG